MWKSTDPRHDIGKRADIVILRPYAPGIIDWPRTCFAYVDVKESFSIWTKSDNYNIIDVDDDWPEDWQWCFAPRSL